MDWQTSVQCVSKTVPKERGKQPKEDIGLVQEQREDAPRYNWPLNNGSAFGMAPACRG